MLYLNERYVFGRHELTLFILVFFQLQCNEAILYNMRL